MEHHRTRLIPMLAILLTLGFQVAASAERAWPKQTAALIFVSRPASSLPEALRSELLRLPEFNRATARQPTLPNSIWVARVDLDGNRVDEFIVRSPLPNSGGPMMVVFEQQKDAYVQIGDLQGTAYFGSRVNGHLEIVSQSRAGAGEFTRVLYRYERNQYEPVRVADYREAKAGGALEFVRERNPTQFKRPR